MIAPGFASYAATKHAVSCFGEAMFFELKRNIDVTVWEPGYIESNIHLETPPGFLTLTAKDAVNDIFNKFGIRRHMVLSRLLSSLACQLIMETC